MCIKICKNLKIKEIWKYFMNRKNVNHAISCITMQMQHVLKYVTIWTFTI